MLLSEIYRGNLSTKSLTSVVDPRILVRDSEYIETHLVAVPAQQVKEFLKTYETVSPMVVPRSATLVASDDEFSLYAVTTFKKHSPEFLHKCREHKWVPREFKYVEGGREEEQREVERVGDDAKRLWGETLRLGRTGWSEAVMVWIHVLVLRVFVETVLRYGLPLDYVCALVRVCQIYHCELVLLVGLLFSCLHLPDNTEASRKGEAQPRREVFLSGRERFWARQEGPGEEGRAHRCPCRRRRWGGVHAIRLLRVPVRVIASVLWRSL